MTQAPCGRNRPPGVELFQLPVGFHGWQWMLVVGYNLLVLLRREWMGIGVARITKNNSYR